MPVARISVLVLVVVIAVAGCSRVGRVAEGVGGVVGFGGGSAKVSASGPEKRRLTVTVPADTGDAKAIREAAASAANEYCINRFGSSEKEWARDPETGEVDFVMQGNRVAFAVKCTG